MNNPADIMMMGMIEYVAQGKIVMITLPNGTSLIVAPSVLEKYHHLFSSPIEVQSEEPDVPPDFHNN